MDVICNLSLYTVRLYSLFMRLIIYHNDNILRQPSCISFHVMSRSVNVFLLLTRVSERAVVFLRCFVCGTCSIILFPRGITATHAGVHLYLPLSFTLSLSTLKHGSFHPIALSSCTISLTEVRWPLMWILPGTINFWRLNMVIDLNNIRAILQN